MARDSKINKKVMDFAHTNQFSQISMNQFISSVNPSLFGRYLAEYNEKFIHACRERPDGASHSLSITKDIQEWEHDIECFKIFAIDTDGETRFEFERSEDIKVGEWMLTKKAESIWMPDNKFVACQSGFHFIVGIDFAQRYIEEASRYHQSKGSTTALSVHKIEISSYCLALVGFSKHMEYFMWGGRSPKILIHEKPVFVKEIS